MKTVMLSPSDQMFRLATHKVIITYTDLVALGANATGTIAIIPASGTFPAGTKARFAQLDLVTTFDFSDAGITSLLIEVGDGGDTDRLLTQTQIAVDGTEVLSKVEGAVSQPWAYQAADTIDALFTVANGGSPLLNEATSGEVHLYLWIEGPASSDIRQIKGKLS